MMLLLTIIATCIVGGLSQDTKCYSTNPTTLSCDPNQLLVIKPAPCTDKTVTPFWHCNASDSKTCGWTWDCTGNTDPCSVADCAGNTRCYVASSSPVCLPIDPCANMNCGESTCKVGLDGTASCVPTGTCIVDGKPQCDPEQLKYMKPAACVNTTGSGFWNCVPSETLFSRILNSTSCSWKWDCDGKNPCPSTCPADCVAVNGVANCIATDPCASANCGAGTVCRVVEGATKCISVCSKENPCPTDTSCVTVNGIATCVANGKPGTCPKIDPSLLALVDCAQQLIPACKSDLECPADQKCCSTVCGVYCTTPAVGTTRPGTCPAVTKDATLTPYRSQCSYDSDCADGLKCCDIGYGNVCVKPAESPCTACPVLQTLVAEKLCPDGSPQRVCDKSTCTWKFRACPCACDITKIDVSGKNCYDSIVSKFAAASGDNSTGGSCAPSPSCYNSDDGSCYTSYSCEKCLYVPPPLKCVRKGYSCVSASDESLLNIKLSLSTDADKCLDFAVCSYDASANKCVWDTATPEYKACVTKPIEYSNCALQTTPCGCASNPNCEWCVAKLPLKNSVISSEIRLGTCLRADPLHSRCVSPLPIGFNGIVTSVDDCKTTPVYLNDDTKGDQQLTQALNGNPILKEIGVRVVSFGETTNEKIQRLIEVISSVPLSTTQKAELQKVLYETTTNKVWNDKVEQYLSEIKSDSTGSSKKRAVLQSSNSEMFLYETSAPVADSGTPLGISKFSFLVFISCVLLKFIM